VEVKMKTLLEGAMELLSLGAFVGMVWVWAAVAAAPGV
jgi:hypothetical protein